MANLSFDFNKIQRNFFNVTMKDGTRLQVKMPKKRTFEKMKQFYEAQSKNDADLDEIMDVLGGLIADVLSNNLNGIRVSAEQIEDYDLEERMAFISEYSKRFLGILDKDPNSESHTILGA